MSFQPRVASPPPNGVENADMIALKELNKSQAGFGGDDNTIAFVRKGQEPQSFPPVSKKECINNNAINISSRMK